MKDELRLVFLILGVVAIVGILLHGIWSIRKNNQSNAKQAMRTEPLPNLGEDMPDKPFSFRDSSANIGSNEVRSEQSNEVVSQRIESDVAPTIVMTESSITADLADVPNDDLSLAASDMDFKEVASKPEAPTRDSGPVYASVVTQPKPEFSRQASSLATSSGASTPTAAPLGQPPPSLLKKSPEPATQAAPEISLTPSNQEAEPEVAIEPEPVAEKELSIAQRAKRLVSTRRRKSVADKIRKDPVVGSDTAEKDQIRIDFEDSVKPTPSVDAAPKTAPANKPSAGNMEVLVLNIKASEEQPIQGASLLPLLLTLGLKFGEQDIFHRHVNINGKGPVLFSLANMVKPGVFDIEQMETFTTPGISLFMMLPIEGDPQQVFNMMHNAARKIADQFGAQVLDGKRQPISKQSLQQYAERIRDFERKQ